MGGKLPIVHVTYRVVLKYTDTFTFTFQYTFTLSLRTINLRSFLKVADIMKKYALYTSNSVHYT
jgi:hypothetical protein